MKEQLLSLNDHNHLDIRASLSEVVMLIVVMMSKVLVVQSSGDAGSDGNGVAEVVPLVMSVMLRALLIVTLQ